MDSKTSRDAISQEEIQAEFQRGKVILDKIMKGDIESSSTSVEEFANWNNAMLNKIANLANHGDIFFKMPDYQFASPRSVVSMQDYLVFAVDSHVNYRSIEDAYDNLARKIIEKNGSNTLQRIENKLKNYRVIAYGLIIVGVLIALNQVLGITPYQIVIGFFQKSEEEKLFDEMDVSASITKTDGSRHVLVRSEVKEMVSDHIDIFEKDGRQAFLLRFTLDDPQKSTFENLQFHFDSVFYQRLGGNKDSPSGWRGEEDSAGNYVYTSTGKSLTFFVTEIKTK